MLRPLEFHVKRKKMRFDALKNSQIFVFLSVAFELCFLGRTNHLYQFRLVFG